MIKTTTTTYIKISGITLHETGLDENGKLYLLTVDANVFADFEKTNKLSSVTRCFENCRYEDCTLESAYIKLSETFDNPEKV